MPLLHSVLYFDVLGTLAMLHTKLFSTATQQQAADAVLMSCPMPISLNTWTPSQHTNHDVNCRTCPCWGGDGTNGTADLLWDMWLQVKRGGSHTISARGCFSHCALLLLDHPQTQLAASTQVRTRGHHHRAHYLRASIPHTQTTYSSHEYTSRTNPI